MEFCTRVLALFLLVSMFSFNIGKLQAQTDDDYPSHPVQFIYDARGRLVRVENDEGNETAFQFDDAGNRKSLDNGDSEPVITKFLIPDVVYYSDQSLGNEVVLTWDSVNTSDCELSINSAAPDHQSPGGSIPIQITQETQIELRCWQEDLEHVVPKTVLYKPATGSVQ